mmetsp:Transcript_26455/g.63116  ORF Transcript_26455/g.63116 Transcript_26455/m.63116 type:complete len:490 (-) Transcript_26455:119-1588(-)
MSSKEKKTPGIVEAAYKQIASWLPWNLAVRAKDAKCGNCKVTAEVYCVDCKKVMCKFCTTLLHHPDTKNEQHSLEDIVKENEDGVMPEVKIISPILLDLILVAAGMFFYFSSAGISPEYFSGASYCPGLARVRYWTARFDANVFFYFKNELAQYCDWEDSYWRFFMDTWIRSVLTNTDSWILLFASFLKAATFEEFLRIIITPVVAAVYATLAYIVRSIEFWLHKILYERLEGSTHTVTKLLQRLSRVVQFIRVSSKLGIDSVELAPPTHRRKRPASDIAEYFVYAWRRRFRLLDYYRAQARAVCNLLLKGSLLAATALRIFCILFGGTPLLSLAHLLGFGARADRHRDWFTEVTGTPVNHGKAYYWTDQIFSVIGHEVVLANMAFLQGYFSKTAWVALESSMSLYPLLMRLWPILTIFLARWMWGQFIQRQKDNFKIEWKKKYSKDIWGDMSRENPCGGTAYKELSFSVQPPKAANGRALRRSTTTMI